MITADKIIFGKCEMIHCLFFSTYLYQYLVKISDKKKKSTPISRILNFID